MVVGGWRERERRREEELGGVVECGNDRHGWCREVDGRVMYRGGRRNGTMFGLR